MVIQLGSYNSLHTHNSSNTLITINKPTQKTCDKAAFNVARSRIDLSDYTDSVFELDQNLPLASKEKPSVNILVEISKDLTFV